MDSFVSVVSVAALFGLIGFWILAKNFGKIAGSTDEDGDEEKTDQGVE